MKVAQDGASYEIGQAMEIGAYCAVDCYAMISGFVGFSEKEKLQKYSRYVVLWLQVVFYCIFITALFYVLRPEVITVRRLVRVIFPVSFGEYWYFTAYTGVFFFMPWLNKVVRNMKKKELERLIGLCLAMFCGYASVVSVVGDPFKLVGGYSFLWPAVLYVLGAYIRKYEIYKCFRKRYLILVYFGFVFLTWIWKFGVGTLSMKMIGVKIGDDILVSYISPTILGSAFVLLLVFAKLKVSGFANQSIKFIAPAAFGVYLLHTHPLVFEYVLKGYFSSVGELPVWLVPGAVLASAFGIFVGGILIDKVRGCLFSILRIKNLAEKIDIFVHKKQESI